MVGIVRTDDVVLVVVDVFLLVVVPVGIFVGGRRIYHARGPPATEIRPLREAEIRAASALVRRVFAEFEAPDYAQEGINKPIRK